MSDEKSEFHRQAAAAIYLQGFLVAKLGLDPDASTAKQVETILVAKLATAESSEKIAQENLRLRHDLDSLHTTIQTLETRLSEAQDLADNHATHSASLARKLGSLESQLVALGQQPRELISCGLKP